jgi:hypothetical protein
MLDIFQSYPSRIFKVIAVLSLSGGSFLSVSGETASEDRKATPYSLFTGMDLQVKLDDGTYPVVGFTKKRITIARNGIRDPLPTKSNLSYAIRQKLSDKWVDFQILETERFYSQLNAEFAAYASAVSQIDREQRASEDYALGRRDNDFVGERRPGPVIPPNGIEELPLAALGSHEGTSRDLDDKLLNPEAYVDSLKVVMSMEVDELYKGVYLVLVARIDSPGTEPDARPLIQVVGQLKPGEVRQVKAVFKNLPEGFNLLGVDVHIYSMDEEIPYHGSKDLKKLSEEEAFKHSLGKYMTTGGKIEPALFRSLSVSEVSAFLTEKEITRIKADFIVHPDGTATVDFVNPQDQPWKDRLVGILQEVRFYPAVYNGEAMESRTSIPLSKLLE